MVARIRLVLTVYAFGAVGVFLLVAPWSPVWDAATRWIAPTAAGELVRSGWLRGLLSGLGGLNLWVALQEGASLWRSLREAGSARG